MQLLEFPPPKIKAPRKNPGAFENKLQNHDNHTAALKQGLDTVQTFNDAVMQNLLARAIRKYLGQEAY